MTVLNLPADLSGDNLREPYFTWTNDNSLAVDYDIEIALDPAFANTVVFIVDIPDLYLDLSDPSGTVTINNPLEFYNRYYWRVRGKLSGGTPLSWSSTFVFTVISTPAPLKPIITDPLNGDIVTKTKVITFEEALFADKHLVQISERGSFNDLVVDDEVSGANVTVSLDYGKKYYLRIKGKGIGGLGEYSEDMYFIVEDAP